MMQFKTLKEKSDEWNISLRHLQYLCMKGRIEGAVKRAGTWFVPDSAPIPARYTKAKNGDFNFVGTKKSIFYRAIELFQSRGFETVSMKDIADAVGITQSSLYNHFKSKNEILDTIYDFYHYYYLKDRPTLEELEPVLQNGSIMDIIVSLSYKFSDDYIKQMSEISTIIFYRCAIDDKAREITKSLMIDEGVRYVEAVFDRAVEIGRIAPVDTRTLALMINSIRIFTLHSWIANSSAENIARLERNELNLYQLTSKLLTDLKPPGPARAD